MLRSRYGDEEKCLRQMLREARNLAGLRQADLSSLLGVPQSFVSKYESGERVLTFVEAIEIFHHLGASPILAVEKIQSILNEAQP